MREEISNQKTGVRILLEQSKRGDCW